MRRRIHRKGTPMALLGVPMPREMKLEIDRIADTKEMSTSALVRAVLKGYLTSREKQQAEARREPDAWSQPRMAGAR